MFPATDPSESRLRAAFGTACELAGEARDEYLRELEETDEALAQHLRVLLDADETGDGAGLEHGVSPRLVAEALQSVAPAPPDVLPGRVGPYRVLERLGHGGMGDVYLAQQEQPLRRRVALKVIRLGMDSREVLERFEQERQVLALLDHPHVARILDAGMDDAGRPYFAMEVVSGDPLTLHCEQAGLDLEARLTLFSQVCDAVEHAHRKGVLHGDLKPANVLVSPDGRCKVIDFGVAHVVGAEAVPGTGQRFLGTPGYMSPEQAGSSGDIDTRSDVYSLGVLLYELLAGRRPYEQALREATSLSGMLAVVREQEPDAPRTLRPELPEDLDWITLCALAKDRERRYGSPAELAADLRRFRDHEPVRARPPSARDRIGKLARKHRVAFTGAGAVVLTLLAGLASTSTMYVRATRAERRTRAGNDDIRRLADLRLVREAEREADALWPVDPERIEALEEWLASYARPLRERIARHEARLAELRARALPWTEEDQASGRAADPRQRQLVSARLMRAYQEESEVGTGWSHPTRIALIHELEATLEHELSQRLTWRFDQLRDQWEHDTLTELVTELERFFDPDPTRGAVANVEHRIEEARRIAEVTCAAEEDGSWAAACAAIRTSARYAGLELSPQRGLVPLGPDPVSGLWEFWHVATGSRPRGNPDPAATSRWEIASDTGLVLVLIPGGTHTLGAQSRRPSDPHHDPRARRNEPVHDVELWPYFLSRYEMTRDQWVRAGGALSATYYRASWPVQSVTWSESAELLRRFGLTLPTEAQWEVAARGGSTSPWWCGAEPASLQGCANIADRSARGDFGRLRWIFSAEIDDGWRKLAPIGMARANGFGLHDVAGNVLEWCADPYLESGWTARVGDGFHLPPEGVLPDGCVARGGAWIRPAEDARSSARESFEPGTRLEYIGVRPARPLDRYGAKFPELDPRTDIEQVTR